MSILAVIASVGIGKALNNTNTKLPGWTYSAHAGLVLNDKWEASANYTKLFASQLGENSAISTATLERKFSRWSIGGGVVTGTSYAAAVWWDKDHRDQTCGVEGCGIRYENDGTHFSRACHLCGGAVSAAYSLGSGFSLRAEYYGIRKMQPTFQGLIVQMTYSVGVY